MTYHINRTRITRFITWTLIVTFSFSLYEPWFEGQFLMWEKYEAKIAEISNRLENIHQNLQKAKPVAQTALDLSQMDIAKAQDEGGNPIFVGVQAPDEAIVGDVIPVTVVAKNATTIAKINLTIDDPSRGITHFKDSYINRKKDERFIFDYDWDTYLAQTKVDTGDFKHTITAEAFKEENGQFIPLLDEDDQPAIAYTKILPDPGFDPLDDDFWRAYLKEDGSMDSAWKNKLGCQSSDDCKTRDQINSKLSSAITSGSFTEDDFAELNNEFTRYTHHLETNGFPSDEQGNIAATVYNFVMMDLVTYLNEQMDAQAGLSEPSIDEETLMAPETMTIMEVLNEYSVKIASYSPQSLEEFQKMEIWPEIQKKIEDKIAKDSEDQITDINQVKPLSASFNPLGIKKAKAWIQVAAGVVITGWDTYNFIRRPSWRGAALIALDVVLIPFGGASIAEKIFVGGARLLAEIPVVARGIQWIKNLRVLARASEAVKGAWAGIKDWAESNPVVKKIGQGIGKWWSATAWPFLRGRFKKAWSALVQGARWAAYVVARNALLGEDCGCTSSLFKKYGLLGVFATPICNIICLFVRAMLELADWIIKKFPQAIEAYHPPDLKLSRLPINSQQTIFYE